MTFRVTQLPKTLKEQMSALLFMSSIDVMIKNFIMTNNSGINLVAINVLGNSVLNNVTIQNIVSVNDLKDSYLISSAAVFEFHNISMTNYSNPMHIGKYHHYMMNKPSCTAIDFF